MNVTILQAHMEELPDGTLAGSVRFQVKGHGSPYELSLRNEKGEVWDYSLHFAGESGSDEQIAAVSERIDEDDELFDRLLDAALATLEKG